jgi:hypothetical protein
LSCKIAEEVERTAKPKWLWKSKHHAKLVDGFTFTMPDTPKNQAMYPQLKAQQPGVGLPIARATAILSLATACIMDLAIGPYQGKATGESALLRSMLRSLSRDDIDELYGISWNSELDNRSIKSNLNLAHVRCKSPAMVHREVRTTVLAYNLIRSTAAGASLLYGKQPHQISFTSTCQYVLASWMLLSNVRLEPTCKEAYLLTMLEQIARCEVANRPGLLEIRVLKRRRHGYKLMLRPRNQLRRELRKHCT